MDVQGRASSELAPGGSSGKSRLVLRYQFLVVRHTLLGFQSGSDISAMKPEKELNHQLDFDYVLTASYFDGLLSRTSA